MAGSAQHGDLPAARARGIHTSAGTGGHPAAGERVKRSADESASGDANHQRLGRETTIATLPQTSPIAITARDEGDRLVLCIPSRRRPTDAYAVLVLDPWGQPDNVRCSCTAASYGMRCWHQRLAERLVPLLADWCRYRDQYDGALAEGFRDDARAALAQRDWIDYRVRKLGVCVTWEVER